MFLLHKVVEDEIYGYEAPGISDSCLSIEFGLILRHVPVVKMISPRAPEPSITNEINLRVNPENILTGQEAKESWRRKLHILEIGTPVKLFSPSLKWLLALTT